MAVWAYACRPCRGDKTIFYVSQAMVDEMSPDVRIFRILAGGDWFCTVIDRSRRISVEGMLIQDVVASDQTECPDCAQLLASRHKGPASPKGHQLGSSADDALVKEPAVRFPSVDAHITVQAAAISLKGVDLVVVAASLGLVDDPGEAALAIADLESSFGGVPVVLVAQDDTDELHYSGNSNFVEMLVGIPIDKMPWKEYQLA